MEEVYTVFKGFLDPLFIVFVLILVSCVLFLLIVKRKTALWFYCFLSC